MSRPPSARVATWTLTSDGDRERWDAWAGALSAARHPSLARVEEVSRTEDTGTLVLSDPDSESVTEWAARTGASVPERLGVLRAAAAALDALYAGSDTAPGVPHGGVSTESVRVAADGSTRIVGFAPLINANLERFRAPELVAGSPATRSADGYAFACLVADVLGGPRVVAAEDLPARIQALRTSPDTRRRARLIKAIVSALTDPPEVRPHPLTSWLTAAVEGTAATEVSGRIMTADAQPVAAGAELSRRNWWLPAGIAVVLFAGIGLWATRGSDDHSARPPAAVETRPFIRTAMWAPVCGSESGIAGLGDISALRNRTQAADLVQLPRKLEVGRWHQGRVLIKLSVSARTTDVVTVLGVEARNVLPASSPQWIARPAPDCRPGPSPSQTYQAVLGEDRLASLERPGKRPQFSPNGHFPLLVNRVVIALDVTSCGANYEWQPVIHYSVGDRTEELALDQTFTTYGAAQGAEQVQLATGKAPPQRLTELTGSDESC